MTKNTGEGQKEIGDNGKENNLRKEEQWRQLGKKKRVEQDESGIREWIEEDKKEMSNMIDLYYELQRNPRDEET